MVFAAGPFDASRGTCSGAHENGATMPPQTIEARVERLEERVAILEELPGRVDALSTQISQLRQEMHGEFSSVRDEIRAVEDRVATGFRVGDERLLKLHEELKAEVRAGNERIMSQARTLYEDLKASWALMQEGQPPRRPPPK